MFASFELDGSHISISKSTMSGGVKLLVDGQPIELQSGINPASQFQFKSKKVYEVEIKGRKIIIERVKPVFFGYYRPWMFHFWVDGVYFQTLTD